MKTTKTLLVLALFLAFSVLAQSLVKSKAGILVSSGDKLLKLKSNSVLKPDDKYRILLQPDSGGYGYFVMITNNKAKLLTNSKAYKDQILAYPPKGNYEKFPKKGDYELVLLYSINKTADLDNLFKNNPQVKAESFNKIFGALKKKIKQSVTDDSQVNINIAGNVRGDQNVQDKDFLKKLKPFGTKDVLILQYKIKVK
ncbi:MAG: hypothetical protein IPG53_02680 [Ignavibacteriales bacterium]|nr:hypothetical protein [Ignavibacteriales bacterium]